MTVSVSGGTATAGTDYPAISDFTITIPAGQASASATQSVDPTEDNLAEGPETIVLTASATDLMAATATLTITDNDDPPTEITLSLDPATLAEGDTTTTVEATATFNNSPLSTERIVTVTVSGGTATSGTDYTPIAPFDITMLPGQSSATVDLSFTPTQDNLAEGEETVTLTATAAGMTAGSDTLTISDDDAPPTALSLQLSPAAVGEDAASTQITATVSLNNSPVPADIQVTVSPASAGEAVPGTDYPAISEFTITIPEGQTSATGQFPFDPTQDGLAEGDERIILSATATDLTAATAALTINDDDPPTAVTLSLSTTTLTEDAAPTPTTLTADLVGSPVPWATSVTVSASGGTATAGTDYQVIGTFEITIPATTTTGSAEITIHPTQDNLDEDDETVTFNAAATGLTAGTATLTITDDDQAGITVAPTALIILEGTTTTYTVALDSEPTGDVTVTVNNPSDNTDITADQSSLTFTPATWNVPQTVTLTAAQDGDDAHETATVTHDAASTADSDYHQIATPSLAIILTDDAPDSVAVSFQQTSYTAAEGGTAEITVELDLDPERTITIPLSHAGRSGATSSDYSGVPTTITFHSGDTLQSFTVTATDDTYDDDDETVRISLGTLPAHAAPGANTEAIVYIGDNDLPDVTVSFDQAAHTVLEGDSVVITLSLNAAPERTVAVPIITTNQGGATSADHAGIPSEVTFDSDSTEATFTVSAVADSVDDDDESVLLTFGTMPAQVTPGTVAQSTISLTDDDNPTVSISFLQESQAASEGGSIDITVTLSADPERDLTIPITATNQGTTTGADYLLLPAEVQFASGETTAQFTFLAVADPIFEIGETVLLAFGTLPPLVTRGIPATTTVGITERSRSLTGTPRCLPGTTYEISVPGHIDVCSILVEGRTHYEVNIKGRSSGSGTLEDPHIFRAEHIDNSRFTTHYMGPARPPNDAGPGLDSRVRFPMIYPGIYHLHIGSNNNGTGTYRITVNKTGQVDDIPANPRTSASLKLGAPARSHYLGNGGANDRDWYRTNLTRGITYRFDVGGDHLFEDEYRLLVPHIVGIYDADSNLAENTSITPTAPTPVVSVEFTAPATGRYYVSVGTTAGHKGMYRIILSDSRNPVTFPARTAVQQQQDLPIETVNSPATGKPVINGRTEVNETVTVSTSQITDPDGITNTEFSYQWSRNDGTTIMPIPGATAPTHTVQEADIGHQVSVTVSFTDDQGFTESLTSEEVYVQAPSPLYGGFIAGSVPDEHDGSTPFKFEIRFSEEPSLGFAAVRDHVLDVTNGEVTAVKRSTTGSNEQWQITLQPDDSNDVTIVLPPTTDCSDAAAVCTGTGKMLSNSSSRTVTGPGTTLPQLVENSPASGRPAITGPVQVGETLTVDTSGIADDDGLTGSVFAYQWNANDGTTNTAIAGATSSTYTPTVSQVSNTITVRVTFTDDQGNTETLTSHETTAVAPTPAPAPPSNPAHPVIATVNSANTQIHVQFQDPIDTKCDNYYIEAWGATGHLYRVAHQDGRGSRTLPHSHGNSTSSNDKRRIDVVCGTFTGNDGRRWAPDIITPENPGTSGQRWLGSTHWRFL